MKKYLVVYMDVNRQSDYLAFIDGTTEENYKAAKEKYDELLRYDNIYTVNLCEVIESTDY